MGKAYVIAHPKIKDMEKFRADYASKVDATIEAYGGKFLVRTSDKLASEGEQGTLSVVIEFESKEKAMGWYNSEAHQQIVGAWWCFLKCDRQSPSAATHIRMVATTRQAN